MYDKPIPITSLLTQYRKITIGFSFYNTDGYVKNSEPKDFYFLEAIKPEAFTPTEPQGKDRLNYLLANGLTDLRWKEGGHNTLELVNADSEVVRELELSGFVQEQADLGETNPQSEKYVQNKSTKYLRNEGADGTSPYATESFVGDVLSNISDKIGVPKKTSQLENDGDGVSKFVTESETYSREEVNNIVSSINSMKKEIVDTLPTENIDENTIYLVPKTNGSGNDYYDEYLYINGNFEFIGSTQIDLSQYVKFTNYATDETAGLVRPTNGIGLVGTNSGAIGILKSDEKKIDARTDNYHPIVPSNLDYAVGTTYLNGNGAPSLNTEAKFVGQLYVDTLNNKTYQCTAIDNDSKIFSWNTLVRDTNYATSTKGGVVKVAKINGLQISSSGMLTPIMAERDSIDGKENKYKAIVPANLDYAVKSGLVNNKLSWTESEKQSVRDLIGVTELVGDINTALETILGV